MDCRLIIISRSLRLEAKGRGRRGAKKEMDYRGEGVRGGEWNGNGKLEVKGWDERQN